MSSTVFLILGILLLFIGGEVLVRGSVSIAIKLKVSTLVVGMTIVSFATSAPELFVSLQSLFYDNSSIALGNIIGSNIANIGLVLSCTAIIYTLNTTKQTYLLNYPFLLFCSLFLFLVFLFFNGIPKIFGYLFIILLFVFLFILIKRSRREYAEEDLNSNQLANSEQEDKTGCKVLDKEGLEITTSDVQKTSYSWFKSFFYFFSGFFLLKYGAEFLVQGAIGFANFFNISDRIVALTVVAIGTSVPELATSIIAAFRKEADLALGNIIGSNIFNILAVLGISSLAQDIIIDDNSLIFHDSVWMIVMTILLGLFIYSSSHKKISRLHGFVFLFLYLVYIYTTIV